jgi:hypothetical protein
MRVVTWRAFAGEAPEAAAAATELFERFGFVLVGTIRADGAPRISAVEVHLGDSYRTRQRRELLAKENRAARD